MVHILRTEIKYTKGSLRLQEIETTSLTSIQRCFDVARPSCIQWVVFLYIEIVRFDDFYIISIISMVIDTVNTSIHPF